MDTNPPFAIADPGPPQIFGTGGAAIQAMNHHRLATSRGGMSSAIKASGQEAGAYQDGLKSPQ